MADKSNEQRDAPPSARKLRDLRKRGQVSTSKDMVGAASLACAVGFFLLAFGGVFGAGLTLLTVVGNQAGSSLHDAEGEIGKAIVSFALRSAVPPLILVTGATLLANLAVLRGIPFALDPIKPNFDKLNPVEGLKKLFSLKALVELGKSVIKVAIIGTALFMTLYASARGLASIPACGTGCMGQQASAMARPLLVAASGMFLFFGMLDVGLQGWLFRRDQKMGKSELKRERKESEGDPIIRSVRRRLMSEARNEVSKGNSQQPPSLIIFDGQNSAVGLRYAKGETPVPVVVSRATGLALDAMLDDAGRRGVGVAEDPGLVGQLQAVPLGAYVPEASYRGVANAMRSAGLL